MSNSAGVEGGFTMATAFGASLVQARLKQGTTATALMRSVAVALLRLLNIVGVGLDILDAFFELVE